MIGNENPSKIWGIWVRANKTFYWLETGGVHLQYGDKLRSILIAKDILKYKTDGKIIQGEEAAMEMNMEQASEKGYEIVRLCLNPHIQKVVEEHDSKKITISKNPW